MTTWLRAEEGHDSQADGQVLRPSQSKSEALLHPTEDSNGAEEEDAAGCWWWKEAAVKTAIAKQLLSEENPLALFYNLTMFRREIAAAKTAFPSHFYHTMALKANPVLPLLRIAGEEGLGFEAASHGELFQALKAAEQLASDDSQGTAQRRKIPIVFDSPTKRRAEVALALRECVFVNCDNFQEIAVVAQLLQDEERAKVDSPASEASDPYIGVRINPQVGAGSMDVFSTAGLYSKFGIGIDQESDILDCFAEHKFLNGVMVHVGSQGCPAELHVRGIRRVVDVALEVNRRHHGRIKFIDVGGGLSVNFESEVNEDGQVAISFAAYADMLRDAIPELFTGEFIVLTEFGRRYNAKQGFIVSRVEYNKSAADRNIAAVHAGADLFTRYVWHPHEWRMRVSVLSEDGELRPADEPRPRQDVAGPCCIAGDVVAHRRALPFIRRGNYVLFHDQGSYAYSSFSYYNSRQAPAILGFEEDDVVNSLRVLKQAVTVEETMSFFGE